MTQSRESSVPGIRLFQFDSDQTGAIKSSVNLYRGTVNLPIPLLELSGREGLKVKIAAVYQGASPESVRTRNLEAPTGILGQGWSMPIDRIEIRGKKTGAHADDEYFLVGGALRSRLVPTTWDETLFELEGEHRAALEDRGVTDHLAATFDRHGHRLSSSAQIESAGADAMWIVRDSIHERSYRVAAQDNRLLVTSAGRTYQAESYDFSRITYFAEYERWEIVQRDGTTSTYGGGLESADTDEEKPKRASRDVVQWGVRWGNWLGPSSVTKAKTDGDRAQTQYATAWNLASLHNRWGDEIRFAYEADMQKVGGDDGLPYTKSTAVREIVDVYGRRVVFHYQAKVFDNRRPDATREYLDPHRAYEENGKPIPFDPTTPNAYQDRYETSYLAALEVVADDDGNDVTLQRIEFDYELANASGLAEDDWTYGDTTKRYLSAVRVFGEDGARRPGMEFRYATDERARRPGAMTTIVYPGGGVATYEYGDVELESSERSLEFDRPDGFSDATRPYVFFGADYAVTAWYDSDRSKLDVTVYEWVGEWRAFRPWAEPLTVELEASSLAVHSASDFFALTYRLATVDEKHAFWLLRKDNRRLAEWIVPEEPEIVAGSADLRVVSGVNFVAAATRKSADIVTMTWDRPRRTWVRSTLSARDEAMSASVSEGDQLFLAARDNYILAFVYDSIRYDNQLSLFHLDDLGRWRRTDTASPTDIRIDGSSGIWPFYWAPQGGSAAATWVRRVESRKLEYTVRICAWDENFAFEKPISFDLDADRYVSSKQVDTMPFVATGGNEGLYGSGPHVFRFDGVMWHKDELDSRIPVRPGNNHWFRYGVDTAMLSENAETQALGSMLVYDPNRDGDGWSVEPAALLDVEGSVSYRKRRYWPTATGDLTTMGQKAFGRGFWPGWWGPKSTAPREMTPAPIEGDVDTTVLLNGAPNFIAYPVYSPKNPDLPLNTTVAFLRNGRVRVDDGEIVTAAFDGALARTLGPDGRPQSNTNGQYPGGPNAFATYLPKGDGRTFSRAKKLALYRFVDGAVDGRQIDRPVVSITIDDGYASRVTTYRYDTTSARFDASGTVAQYHRTWTFAGAPVTGGAAVTELVSPPKTRDGHTELRYYNGSDESNDRLRQVGAGSDVERLLLLEGYQIERIARDAAGGVVARDTTEWEFVSTREVVVDGERRIVDLDGGYVRSRARSQSVDGVALTTTLDFDAYSGQESSSTTSSFDTTGREITKVETTSFAYVHYPEMRARNALAAVATKSTRGGVEGEDELVARRVTTWRPWSVRGGTTFAEVANYRWTGVGSPEFDSAWWTETETEPSPASWLRDVAITSRNDRGGATLLRKPVDLNETNLYDASGLLVTAQISNAAASDGICFAGFESYEDSTGWSYRTTSDRVTSVPITTEDSHTGRACFETEASSRLETKVVVDDVGRTLVLDVWYKTSPGFAGAATLTVASSEISSGASSETSGKKSIERSAPSTDGEWRRLTWMFRGSDVGLSAGEELTLRWETSVVSATDFVRLDDVSLVPLDADWAVNIYDRPRMVITAELTPNGSTARTLHNGFLEPVTSVGPHESPQETVMRDLVRDPIVQAARRDDAGFPTASPNGEFSVKARDVGWYSEFKAGSLDEWNIDRADRWSVARRRLTFAGPAGGPLGSIVMSRSTTEGDGRAVRVSVVVDDSGGAATASVGLGTVFLRGGTNGTWDLVTYDVTSGAAKTIRSATRPVGPNGDWLLIVVGRRLVCRVDGVEVMNVFDEAVAAATGDVGLALNRNGSFAKLVVLPTPSLDIAYHDGAGRKIQETALETDESALVVRTLHDRLGRDGIVTRPTRLTSRAKGAPLDFARELITNGAPGGDLWEGRPARGSIVARHPQSDGYPFDRKVFEASPMSRPIALGVAGKPFALLPNDANDHVLRSSYRANVANEFGLGLPAGQYNVTETVDADGLRVIEARDKRGLVVAKRSATKSDDGAMEVFVSTTSFDLRDDAVLSLPPNHFRDGGGFETRLDRNGLGQVIAATTPDAGTSRTIVDRAGRRRLLFDANGAAAIPTYVVYKTYDPRGRILEVGRCNISWDREALQNRVDSDARFPADEPGATCVKRLRYDGDDDHPNRVGRPWSVEIYGDNVNAPDVHETFAYDDDGRIVQRDLTVPSFDETTRVVEASYDNAGSLTSMRQGDDVVRYRYDRLARMVSVGDGDDAAAYGRYGWDQGGRLARESLGPVGRPVIERSFAYLAPGWIESDNGTSFDERLDYTSGGIDDRGSFTGLVARAESTWPGDADANDADHRGETRYAYDSNGRMTEAAQSVDASKSDYRYTYDANGNMTSETIDGGPTDDFVRIPTASNRIGRAKGQTYSFDANGQVVDVSPRGQKFTWHPILGRPTRIDAKSTKSSNDEPVVLTYLYGGDDSLVLRTATGGQAPGTSLFVRQDESRPAVEESRRPDGTTSRTSFIYGPTGLVATRRDGDLRYMIRDREGSVRVVADTFGQVIEAFAYEPYGEPIVVRGDLPTSRRYLYAGMIYEPDLGLYDTFARFYDPRVGRFYSPDPLHQFTSPYVYAGNMPASDEDPSGEISIGGLIISIAEIVGGLAAAPFTGGASLLLTGAGIAGAVYTGTHPDNFDYGDFFQVEAAAAISTGEILAGIGLEAISEFVPGAATAGALLIGAGISSYMYTVTNTDGFSWSDWGINMGIGAATGLVTGGVGEIGASLFLSSASSIGAKLFVGATAGAIGGAATGPLGVWLTSIAKPDAFGEDGPDWKDYLLAAGVQAGVGIVAGGAGALARGGVKAGAQGRVGALKQAANAPFNIGNPVAVAARKAAATSLAQLEKSIKVSLGLTRTIPPFSFNAATQIRTRV